jgi:hypothetical protein
VLFSIRVFQADAEHADVDVTFDRAVKTMQAWNDEIGRHRAEHQMEGEEGSQQISEKKLGIFFKIQV